MDLTDEQWAAVEPLLPKPQVREDGRGRAWRDPRDVLNGVLWVLRTGAPWADIPERYPPYATCFRRFQGWVEEGTLQKVLQHLADDLVARGKLDLSETFIDGTHAGAKKGVFLWEKLVGELPPRSSAIADRSGPPISATIASGERHEVRLVEAAIEERFTSEKPQKLIGDKAYDSAQLEEDLAAQDIQLIAPVRGTNTKRWPDGRSLRRYKRRWKVERLFAWLMRFRRLTNRYEAKADNFSASSTSDASSYC